MNRQRRTSSPHSATALAANSAAGAGVRAWLPTVLLCGVLIILAMRLTWSEEPVEEFGQLAQRLMAPADATLGPIPGPATIVSLALLTAVLLGTGLLAGVCRITRGAWIVPALGAGLLSLVIASSIHASNPFAAMVGTFDLALGLLGGWAVMLLANTESRRRLVLAVLLAVLAAWITKALYQRIYDIPDTIRYYHEHKAEIWRQHGWSAGDYHITLFEGRMNSQEVTGFFSLANVFAQGMIPLLLLGLGLLIGTARAKVQWSKNEVPVALVCAIALALLTGLGGCVLVLTQSKGASAAVVLGAGLLAAGWWFRKWLHEHWRQAALGTLLVWLVGTAAVVAYGVRHDGLPSRSLLFRWQYWTASVPIVRAAPGLGVGLNNFGSYYLAAKRPSAPEDVKDPHNIFVRLAAELGLPATAFAIALLIAWFYLAARRQAKNHTDQEANAEQSPGWLACFLVPVVVCVLWWAIRALLAERLDLLLNLLLSIVFAGAALGGFLLAQGACRSAAAATRVGIFALLAGAAGMLLYDQVNTGLVTGPVAMLFWVCLGLVSAESEGSDGPTAGSRLVGGALLLAAAGGLTILLPLGQGTLPWDPRPAESQYVRESAQATLQQQAALLGAVLEHDPRSIDVRHRLIVVKTRLGRSVQQDIRDLLALTRCDVRLRIDLATLPSDWPIIERLAALREALWLDAQLAPTEPKRLTAAEKQALEAQIAALKAQGR